MDARPGTRFEILLVEDNAADVRLAELAFEELHVPCHLTFARDGEDALARLHREAGRDQAPRPDLILLDLNLPRLDGRAVLSAIKEEPALRNIPVLVWSSSHSDQDVRKAYALHANCYLAKPMNLEEYLRLVHAIEAFWFTEARLLRD